MAGWTALNRTVGSPGNFPVRQKARRLVAFEIGADQGEEVCGLVRQMPRITRVEVRKDLAGRDRMVLGWFQDGESILKK